MHTEQTKGEKQLSKLENRFATETVSAGRQSREQTDTFILNTDDYLINQYSLVDHYS